MTLDDRLAALAADDSIPTTEREARSRARFYSRLEASSAADSTRARRSRGRRGLALGLAAAVVALATGAVAVTLVTDDDPEPEIALGQALRQFPEDTARDVVTWSDVVVIATVVDSGPAERVPTAEEVGDDAAMVNRLLTLHLDSVAWQRPGTRAVPTDFELETWGWIVTADGQQPYSTGDEVEFAEGGTYLLPLAYDRTEWTYRGVATFEVAGDAIRVADWQDTQLADQLRGSTLQDARRIFDVAKPDPAVRPYLDLPIQKRYRAAQSAR